MKAMLKKITAPKMPASAQISDLCRRLSDDGYERAFFECCIALSLAIAPDNERSLYTVYGYACHFSDGFTQNTLEAVRMWTDGEINKAADSDIPHEILDNFRNAYLFGWQRKLIKYALLRYEVIKSNAKSLCNNCCIKLCEYVLNNTSIQNLFDT